MAWKIYINDTRIPREFKTRADAELFWRRNSSAYTEPGKKPDKPIFVETGKGRSKK